MRLGVGSAANCVLPVLEGEADKHWKVSEFHLVSLKEALKLGHIWRNKFHVVERKERKKKKGKKLIKKAIQGRHPLYSQRCDRLWQMALGIDRVASLVSGSVLLLRLFHPCILKSRQVRTNRHFLFSISLDRQTYNCIIIRFQGQKNYQLSLNMIHGLKSHGLVDKQMKLFLVIPTRVDYWP